MEALAVGVILLAFGVVSAVCFDDYGAAKREQERRKKMLDDLWVIPDNKSKRK